MIQKNMSSEEFRRKAKRSTGPDYAGEVIRMCELLELPVPVREHRFAPPRRWRFDLAWPDQRLAVEIEGGIWIQGRHNRGEGFLKDCEKYAEALCRGWRVLRIPTDWFSNGMAMRYVRRALKED